MSGTDVASGQADRRSAPRSPSAGLGRLLERVLPPRERTRAGAPVLVLRALGGPALVVAAVLIVLRHFAFGGLISRQYPDVLPFWLPTYCFLGKSLAAGHIPAWNPHVMGGVPFAADPQSGWMYAPAMVLFSTLSCAAAIRWFVVVNPAIAGLGLYAFLRGEGLGRPASTVGGLALSMPLAGSYLLLNLPFAGTLAWTAVTLAATSRMVRAHAWPARLAWLAASALAWMQIAASNLSDGLVIGTSAVAAYVIARLVVDVRAGRRTSGDAFAIVGLIAVAWPLVDLAYFLPRAAYLPRTSIALGYRQLFLRSRRLTGNQTFGLVFGTGVGNTWPLRLALAPGAYLGAASLALVFAGWRSKTTRPLALGFGLYGAISYVLMLQWFARGLPNAVKRSSLTGFYFHDPSRFRFGLLVALAVLAGVGLEAFLRARWWERPLLLVPGVAVWFALPRALGVGYVNPLLWYGAAGAAAAFALASWRLRLAALVPFGLAVELCVNGLAAQVPNWQPPPGSFPFDPLSGPIDTLLLPTVRADVYVRPTSIARFLQTQPPGRYLTEDPSVWDPRGYHVRQKSWYWGLLGMQQSMVWGRNLEEGQGYNPSQEVRYWSFVRAVERKAIRYNGAAFERPPPVALDLLQVRWIVGRTGSRFGPPPGTTPALRDGQWTLYSVRASVGRASVVTRWRVVRSQKAALAVVRARGFDPAASIVLEPGARPPVDESPRDARGRPTASFRWDGPQAATVDVVAPRPAIVLVRNTYDPDWRATVDGRPAPLLPADEVDQAVPVGRGRHRIRLTYDDPFIGYGLAASGLALALLVALALFLSRRPAGTARSPDVGHAPPAPR